LNARGIDVGDEQFDGVGADVDDGFPGQGRRAGLPGLGASQHGAAEDAGVVTEF
jgi:hypothetical protein